MKKHFIFGTIILAATLFIVSCYTPSPLYGTWSDNTGNKIIFYAEGNFDAWILDSENNQEKKSGSYTVIDNVIVFTFDGGTTNSIWDLNGATLKITWTSDGTTKNLVLYHTAR